MRLKRVYGTHMPVLIRIMAIAPPGPVVEFGAGPFSTPYLHWACFLSKRQLVTYENRAEFVREIGCLQSEWHRIIHTPEWDDADASQPWAVAFVDHEPAPRRGVELGRLTHAQYVIAHDTNRTAFYGYEAIEKLFKYHYKYRRAIPYTTIMSNVHDVSEVMA